MPENEVERIRGNLVSGFPGFTSQVNVVDIRWSRIYKERATLTQRRTENNQWGTAEHWIKEGKHAINCTRQSCHDFVDNQVRLQLFVLACNQDKGGTCKKAGEHRVPQRRFLCLRTERRVGAPQWRRQSLGTGKTEPGD